MIKTTPSAQSTHRIAPRAAHGVAPTVVCLTTDRTSALAMRAAQGLIDTAARPAALLWERRPCCAASEARRRDSRHEHATGASHVPQPTTCRQPAFMSPDPHRIAPSAAHDVAPTITGRTATTAPCGSDVLVAPRARQDGAIDVRNTLRMTSLSASSPAQVTTVTPPHRF